MAWKLFLSLLEKKGGKCTSSGIWTMYWSENTQLLHQRIGKTDTHAWDVKMVAQIFKITSYLN